MLATYPDILSFMMRTSWELWGMKSMEMPLPWASCCKEVWHCMTLFTVFVNIINIFRYVWPVKLVLVEMFHSLCGQVSTVQFFPDIFSSCFWNEDGYPIVSNQGTTFCIGSDSLLWAYLILRIFYLFQIMPSLQSEDHLVVLWVLKCQHCQLIQCGLFFV